MTRGCVWYVCKYVVPPSAAYDEGGVGGRGYELMREVAAIGHECVIVTSDANHLATVPEVRGSHLVEQRDGMLVCWLRTMKFTKARSFRRIWGWLHFEWQLLRISRRHLPRPEVVVVSSPSILTVLNGLVLKRRLGVRLVFEVRDLWPLTLVDEGGYSRYHPAVVLLGVLERLGYSRADAIVGTMPNLGQHVAEVLGREHAVDCVPMGYSPRAVEISAGVPEANADRYLPREKFIVAYAGTIGVANALEPFFAAAEALQTRSDIHFLLLGDGALLETYREQFGQLPNLTLAPKVAKDVVPSVLAQCDLLYVSTREAKRWSYGQSLNKLVDYMLAGKPILASFSGYRSMINEADCGTIVPTGDVGAVVREVVRYAELDEQSRDVIGARGRDWILRHRGYPTLAEQYAGILFPHAGASRD